MTSSFPFLTFFALEEQKRKIVSFAGFIPRVMQSYEDEGGRIEEIVANVFLFLQMSPS